MSIEIQTEPISLEEVSQEVARLLDKYGLVAPSSLHGAPKDQRISAVPDSRTIRYYTTLGLLDRPLIENRQAKYGQKHLLQLLAIKALQGLQLPLATIQEKLYGLSESELGALLESIAFNKKNTKYEPAAPVARVFREIVLEPGLKLTVADDYNTGLSSEELKERIEIALKVLSIKGEIK